MNIIYIASDLSKILEEQVSILLAINSLKRSLQKLFDQKKLPEKWLEVKLSNQPVQLFCEAIDSKSVIIREEIKKLRLLITKSLLFYFILFRNEQIVNLKKMDSLRMNLEQIIQRTLIVLLFLFFFLANCFRHNNNRTLISTNELFEMIFFASDEFLKE